MKKALKISDFCVCFHKDITEEENAEIFEKLSAWNVDKNILERTKENVKSLDCGSTISNLIDKKIIVLFAPQSNKAEMLNTFCHELRHVVDLLLENCPDCELSAAELSGEIASKFGDWI